jgi:hypothetical protein
VPDALGQRLDVAVQHGRVRLDAEGVRDPVDLAPALRIGLACVLQQLGQARREDLGAAAGHRRQPHGLEPAQRVLGLDLPAPPEVVDLRRCERLDRDVGMRGVNRLDHSLVILERPVGMMAADDVDLVHFAAHHRDHVLDAVLVGARLSGLAREAAKGAREHAEVRGRNVTVDDEVNAIALPTRLDMVGHAADAEQVVGLKERQAVVAAETLAGADFVPDRLEAGIRETHGCTVDRAVSLRKETPQKDLTQSTFQKIVAPIEGTGNATSVLQERHTWLANTALIAPRPAATS